MITAVFIDVSLATGLRIVVVEVVVIPEVIAAVVLRKTRHCNVSSVVKTLNAKRH